MRIIHFLNHTRPDNGHVHVAVDLACVQSRMGHSVFVVSGGGQFDSILADHGVKHIVINQKQTLQIYLRQLVNCILRSPRFPRISFMPTW
jgi:hypothetical protein